MNVLARNNVHTRGTFEKTLVFSHGFGCDQTMWKRVVEQLDYRYNIILFDVVGAGLSDLSAFDPIKYETLAGYASDVLEILDILNASNVTFIGHSVSAMIGILAAEMQHKDFIKEMVLVGPSPCYLNDGAYRGGFEREQIEGLLASMSCDYIAWSQSLSGLVMGDASETDVAQELLHSFCNTDPEIAAHFARTTFLSDNRSNLPKVRHPTLILQSRDDAIAPQHVGEYMHRTMPHSTFQLLDVSGHCPHLTHPEHVARAIEDFVTRDAA